jgi:hypothetical protein
MSDFGTATLDLEEKSDFRSISPRAGPKLTEFWDWLISLNFSSSVNRPGIQELKQSIKEMQTSLNAIDKRTAILEERTGNNKFLSAW